MASFSEVFLIEKPRTSRAETVSRSRVQQLNGSSTSCGSLSAAAILCFDLWRVARGSSTTGCIKEFSHSLLLKSFEPLAHGLFVDIHRRGDFWDKSAFARQEDDLCTLHPLDFFRPRLTPFFRSSARPLHLLYSIIC
jgi:hypothetical protein